MSSLSFGVAGGSVGSFSPGEGEPGKSESESCCVIFASYSSDFGPSVMDEDLAAFDQLTRVANITSKAKLRCDTRVWKYR